MGPIANYANANAITGRSGLFPSRYQSDQTDQADGAIVRCGNRRLRAAIMRIADDFARHNAHFRRRAQGVDPRAPRVKIATRFTRFPNLSMRAWIQLLVSCLAARLEGGIRPR